MEKSSNEHKRNFQKLKSQETKIKNEIDSNYDSKMKSKAIRREIRMKNDPLPKIALELIQLLAGIKAINQNLKKHDRGVLPPQNESSLIIENLNLKHSVDVKMSLEAIRSKRFKRFGV